MDKISEKHDNENGRNHDQNIQFNGMKQWKFWKHYLIINLGGVHNRLCPRMKEYSIKH